MKILKTAWASFHPEVEAQIIQVASEDDAKAVKKEITDGGDFTKIAKEKSTDTATKKMAVKLNLIHKQQLFLPKLKKLPSN